MHDSLTLKVIRFLAVISLILLGFLVISSIVVLIFEITTGQPILRDMNDKPMFTNLNTSYGAIFAAIAILYLYGARVVQKLSNPRTFFSTKNVVRLRIVSGLCVIPELLKYALYATFKKAANLSESTDYVLGPATDTARIYFIRVFADSDTLDINLSVWIVALLFWALSDLLRISLSLKSENDLTI